MKLFIRIQVASLIILRQKPLPGLSALPAGQQISKPAQTQADLQPRGLWALAAEFLVSTMAVLSAEAYRHLLGGTLTLRNRLKDNYSQPLP